ncbi:AbrB family transcriptional regulator [Mesorhizobium sp. M1005]|uniref:AbrB family transcriptional regulator n=1 Tax=unclassified Mesorhizobium TaxID=325217 RepID=UPI00333A1285
MSHWKRDRSLMDASAGGRKDGSWCIGLAVAAAGGIAASLAGLAAPWLTGGICAAAVVALSHPFPSPSKWLTNASTTALGISVGSRIGVRELEMAATWPLSLVAMVVTVTLMLISSFYALRRIFCWDVATAFWASSPGAVGIALSMAAQTRADVVKVAIVQLMRVFAVMILLPVGLGRPTLIQSLPSTSTLWPTALVFGICFGLGLFIKGMKGPASMLISGIVGAAFCRASGWFVDASPDSLVIPACIIISAGIGARFSGMHLRDIARLLAPSLVSLLVATFIGILGSLVMTSIGKLPWQQVLIAYAPGGLDALIATSILLGDDPLYVAVHQVARFVLLSLFLPITADIVRARAEQP